MKHLIRLSVLMLISFPSFSQTQLSRGQVILNNNEKVDGFIVLKPTNKNPSKISFSRDSSLKQLVTYNISDLKSFEVFNVDRYVRADISIDMRPFDNTIEIPAKLDTFRTATIWLRELARGQHISLYELFENRLHFYVADANGEFKELIYKKGRQYNRPYDLKSYVIQLQQHLEKADPKSTASFLKTKYTQYELVRAVNLINGNTEVKNETLERDLKIHYSIFAGAGAGTVKAKMSGYPEIHGELDFERKTFPFGTIGADFVPGRKPGLITIRLDLSYNTADHNAKGKHELYGDLTYELHQTNLISSLSLLFNVLNRHNFKFYMAPSFSYHFSNYEGNTFISYYPVEIVRKNFVPLKKVWGSFDVRAGVIINRLELALKGELSGNPHGKTDFSFSTSQYSAMIAYHLFRR